MEHVIVLDREQNFAKALSKHLQMKFPTLIWRPMSNLKELYRFTSSLSPLPKAIIYSADQFPDWTPTWSCQSLILREHPLYQDIFHVNLPALDLARESKETGTAEVYRLDTKAIEFELRSILGRTRQDSIVFNMQSKKMFALVSDLYGRSLNAYLDELFAHNFQAGIRTLVLPFTSIDNTISLKAKLSTPSEGSDLASLLMRLGREVLQAEQLFPYLFPTTKSGILSFIPAASNWHADHASIVAVRQLLALLKTVIKRQDTNDCALVLCSKSTPKLLQQVLPICDELFLLNSADALRNPSIYKQSEDLKAILPPGFPIKERCL